MKRYFYEFKGNVFLEAENQDEAEDRILGISLVEYLIHEDLFEIDDHYIPVDSGFAQELPKVLLSV